MFMLWTILLLVSWSSMGVFQAVVFFSICAGVMGLETVLGVVRVQDYFMAKYVRIGAEERQGCGRVERHA